MIEWWPVIKVVFGILFIVISYDDYLTHIKGVEKFGREMQAEKDLKAQQEKDKVEILEEIKNPIDEKTIELANNVSQKDQTF
jgi:hypothetical protein